MYIGKRKIVNRFYRKKGDYYKRLKKCRLLKDSGHSKAFSGVVCTGNKNVGTRKNRAVADSGICHLFHE